MEIAPGERRRIDIPVSLLSNHTGMNLSVEVVHGRKQGPVLFVSGAVHGDEIIGVEIVRRLRREPALRNLAGTLLLVPVVNAFGFVGLSRYLPDRRDLNRSFPGSQSGSLAAQLAHLFMKEIVGRSGYGVDLHSGAVHRANLPQIRAKLDEEKIRELASAFGAPIVLNAQLRDGSLRQAAQERGCLMLLYEAGEALRFDEKSVRIGVRGVLNVMRSLGMIAAGRTRPQNGAVFSNRTSWARAPMGGVMRARKSLGDIVEEGDILAIVADPFGVTEIEIAAGAGGVIIGKTNIPVVNRGDALFHIAEVVDAAYAGEVIDGMETDLEDRALPDAIGII
ncbi:MAG: M14 family metallopeptidase [Parvularculaceae bacterium]